MLFSQIPWEHFLFSFLNSLVSSAFLEVYFKGNSDHQYTLAKEKERKKKKDLHHFSLDRGNKWSNVSVFLPNGTDSAVHSLPGWELKYFLVPLLARKENKSNKFSNNLERFLLLEEFPTDWSLVFNCLCKCVCAHVCVCVCVCKALCIVPAVFVFWGDTIPTVYTLGT